MTEAEKNQVDPAGNAESPASEPPEGAPSTQRLRAVLAGLVTIAILAVLAIAIFSNDSGNDDNPPTQTVGSDGTGGESVQQPVEGGEELGSLAVSGYLCPAAPSEESACTDARTVEILAATLVLPDGRTYNLEGVERQADGSYAWLNIPIGDYVLLSEGLLGPSGSLPRTVIGSTGQTPEGWQIQNLDPNQPAVLQILFDPLEEGEAAG